MDTGIFIGDKIITTSWDKIWDKPNTLSGYGITDAVTIDTAQEIYGIKTFKSTTTISTALDVKLILQSLDADNYCMIKVQDQNSQDLSYIGYLGNNWYTDGNLILNSGNYTGELDNRYVNKAGDTMTGTLLMSNDSDIYGRSSANSGTAYIIGYRDATISGIVMHDISAANNTKALYIQTNGYDVPSGIGGLAITNDCVTAFGAGDNGSIFRVLNEDDVNLGALFNVAKDGTLTRLGNRIWDAGNDGSGSGLDADLLDGKHLHQGQWDSICYIGGDGVLEIGKYIDFHEEQGMSSDFSCRIMTQGDYQNTLFLPTSSGTLATLGDNVYSATKLQTPRTIFSKPFDGTSNVTGGAKFANICIETDNNGNDSGRGSEINNYNSVLYLQHVSPNNLICCMGGGNVGIGTTSPSYKLHVTGSLMCEGEWIRNTGDYGWYNATHGGGIYMEDSTWVKVYNNKHFQCKGTIFGYRYTTNNNAAAFSFDKPGSYMAGIGSGGSDSLVRLGPCDSTGEWYDWGGQTWQLYGNFLTTGGITMYSDLRKKNVLNSIIVPLDVMANADLFDYTFKTDEKYKVRAGTSAQYWNAFLPQVTDTDNEGFFTMSYDVLATTCVLSMAKHFQRFLIEDFNNHETRIEFLERENKELKDSNKEMMNRIIELERRAA